MSKKCISNNQPKPHQTKKLVAVYNPWDKRKIGIDNCIAPVIKHLWDNEIVTHGSCCGHGEESPSLIIKDNVFPKTAKKEAKRVSGIIKQVDNRDWKIMGWVLTDLN